MVINEEAPVRGMRLISLGLGVLLVLLLAAADWAETLADNPIDRSVLSGGGASAVSEVAALNGSLGQMAIGPSTGGDVRLGAGYWYGVGGGATIWDYQAYLPLVLRNH